MSAILIIDDDRALCRSLELQFGSLGHEVKVAGTAGEGLKILDRETPDLILLDLNLPDRSGLEVLAELQRRAVTVPVVMITGAQDMLSTIEAMRAGAFDYIRKPLDLDEVQLVIEKVRRAAAAGRSRASLSADESGLAADDRAPHEIVGADRKVVEVVKQIGLLSRSRISVLIEGETGTGKELVARALHEAAHPGLPFVAVNCSAVVASLPESELFGHEKGAFTGAETRKTGKLEYAGEGMVFFDEIGDMPLDLQAKLLRVLQEREFERVGGLESIPFKARAVAATNRNLEQMVREGSFREDLFFRLSVSRVVMPPLRDRRGDILLLAGHLLARISRLQHRRVEGIDDEALGRLSRYAWPGNVRELENILSRAVAVAHGPVISADDLEFTLSGSDPSLAPPGASGAVTDSSAGGSPEADAPEDAAGPFVAPLDDVVKSHIVSALEITGWNITRTAKLLRISPTTLRKKIADFGLNKPE